MYRNFNIKVILIVSSIEANMVEFVTLFKKLMRLVIKGLYVNI